MLTRDLLLGLEVLDMKVEIFQSYFDKQVRYPGSMNMIFLLQNLETIKIKANFLFCITFERITLQKPLLRLFYKAKRFAFPGFLHLVLIFYFLNISEFGAKKYFTTYQTANTIQLFFAIKGNLFGLFFY